MKRHRLTSLLALAGVATCLGIAGSVSAAPVPSFTTTTASLTAINAAAAVGDTAIVGTITNILNVTVPANLDWQGAQIRISLTTGTVYNNTSNSGTSADTEDSPTPQFWSIIPQQEFDSFVNRKGLMSAIIAGKLNANGTSGEVPAVGLSGGGGQLVSVAWGDTTLNESGTFPVGRFTLSGTATGSFFGAVADSDGAIVPFGGFVVGGVLIPAFVPEPGTAGLLAAVAGAGLLRRRRRPITRAG
jgi:hypothetical protein